MTEVSVAEAKAHLSELLDRVERGEEVVITRRGQAGGEGQRGAAEARADRLGRDRPHPRVDAVPGGERAATSSAGCATRNAIDALHRHERGRPALLPEEQSSRPCGAGSRRVDLARSRDQPLDADRVRQRLGHQGPHAAVDRPMRLTGHLAHSSAHGADTASCSRPFHAPDFLDADELLRDVRRSACVPATPCMSLSP